MSEAAVSEASYHPVAVSEASDHPVSHSLHMCDELLINYYMDFYISISLSLKLHSLTQSIE